MDIFIKFIIMESDLTFIDIFITFGNIGLLHLAVMNMPITFRIYEHPFQILQLLLTHLAIMVMLSSLAIMNLLI